MCSVIIRGLAILLIIGHSSLLSSFLLNKKEDKDKLSVYYTIFQQRHKQPTGGSMNNKATRTLHKLSNY